MLLTDDVKRFHNVVRSECGMLHSLINIYAVNHSQMPPCVRDLKALNRANKEVTLERIILVGDGWLIARAIPTRAFIVI
jgi:hypothetical protein